MHRNVKIVRFGRTSFYKILVLHCLAVMLVYSVLGREFDYKVKLKFGFTRYFN